MIMMKIMEIKFISDGNLPLSKIIEIPIMKIPIRAVLDKNNKYYLQVFLEECLYKI